MPIGSGIVYNTGDLILSQVSSSGTSFLETKIAAATSSLIYFDSTARINSASLNNISVGTASYTSGSKSIITNLTASNISASSITSSLFGTSSWSTNALTASFLPVGTYNITSSWANNSISSSFATTAQTANALNTGNSYTIAGLTNNGTLSQQGTLSMGSGYQILATAGSAPIPGISFVGDTNTGIYSPGADVISFVTSGSERARIDSNGNMGIGTTSAGSKLQINDTNPTLTIRANDGGVSRKAYIDFYTTFYNYPSDVGARRTSTIITGFDTGVWGTEFLSFNVGSGSANDSALLPIERMRITGAGNVGIGTSNPTNFINSNPIYFSPSSSGTFLSLYSATNEANINLISSASADGRTMGGIYFSRASGQTDAHNQIAAIRAVQGGTSNTLAGGLLHFFTKINGAGVLQTTPQMVIGTDGKVGIGTSSPGALLEVSSSTEANLINVKGAGGSSLLYVSGSGQVGIGTTSPSALLTIANATNGGTIHLVGRTSDDTAAINFRAAGDASTYAYISPDTNEFRMYHNDGYMSFYPGGSAKVIMAANGNVGIGTTSVNSKLDIWGGTGTTFNMANDGDGGRGGKLTFISSSATGRQFYVGTNSSIYNLVFGIDSIEKMRLDINGNLGIGTTSPSYLLDVSGSSRHGYRTADTHQFTGSVSISGSLNATSSWATNALTASFLPVGTYNITSSWANNVVSASYATTAQTANSLVSSNSYTVDGLTANYVEVTGLATIPTTGIYRPSTKALGLSADGTLVFKISNASAPATSSIETGNFIVGSGNVGIGTNNPSYTLQIGQSTAADSTNYRLVILKNGTLGSPGSYQAGAFQVLDYATDGPASVDTTGIVYIVAPRIATSDTNADNASLLSVVNDTGNVLRATGKQNVYVGYTTPTTSAQSNSLFVNGNLGVGTTSPLNKLQVNGNISGSSFTSSITNAVGFLGTSSWANNATTANALSSMNVSQFTNDSKYHYHRTDISSLSSSATNLVQPLSTFDYNNATNGPTNAWYNYFSSTHGDYLTSLIANRHRSADWYVAYKEGPGGTPTNPSWYLLLHSGNYNSYSPTLTGTGASGTWSITSSMSNALNAANNYTVGSLTSTTQLGGSSGTLVSYVTPGIYANGSSTGNSIGIISNTSFANQGAWANIGLHQTGSNANDINAGVYLSIGGWFQNSGTGLPVYIGGGYTSNSSSILNVVPTNTAGSGNVGIGTRLPQGTLHVVGNITASSVTASLFGTSSWANNVVSSSFATTAQTANALNTGNAYTIAGLTNNGTLSQQGTLSMGSGYQILATQGSAATPGIAFSGDTNTGLYGTGADVIAFAISGSEKVRIDSSGNVGVGISSLIHKIQASGLISAGDPIYNNDSTFIGAILNNDGTTPGLDLRRWNGGAAGTNNHGATYIATNITGDTLFYNGLIAANTKASSLKMIITVAGNVGIGTTSPAYKLDVSGSARFGKAVTDAHYYTGSVTMSSGSALNFSTAGATSTTDAKIFFGINPNPLGSLNTTLVTDYGADSTGLILQSSVSGDTGGIKITDDGVAIFGAGDEDLLRVVDEDNNVMRLVINNNGLVGIGTTSPSALFEITGSSNSALMNVKSPISGAIFYISGSGAIGVGTQAVGDYRLQVSGSFAATTKSFVIEHPTKKGKKLIYGSLESPYHGIRLTGRSTIENGKGKVELPEYMHKLILHDSINIQVTGIKCSKTLYVDEINIPENYFVIAYDKGILESYKDYDFFWDFTAIRADVPELDTEI